MVISAQHGARACTTGRLQYAKARAVCEWSSHLACWDIGDEDVGKAVLCIDSEGAGGNDGAGEGQVLALKQGRKDLISIHLGYGKDCGDHMVLHNGHEVVAVKQVEQGPVLGGKKLVEGDISGCKYGHSDSWVVQALCRTQAFQPDCFLPVNTTALGSSKAALLHCHKAAKVSKTGRQPTSTMNSEQAARCTSKFRATEGAAHLQGPRRSEQPGSC